MAPHSVGDEAAGDGDCTRKATEADSPSSGGWSFCQQFGRYFTRYGLIKPAPSSYGDDIQCRRARNDAQELADMTQRIAPDFRRGAGCGIGEIDEMPPDGMRYWPASTP